MMRRRNNAADQSSSSSSSAAAASASASAAAAAAARDRLDNDHDHDHPNTDDSNTQPLMIPDNLILAFFEEATAVLLEERAMVMGLSDVLKNKNKKNAKKNTTLGGGGAAAAAAAAARATPTDVVITLTDCRACVLEQQKHVLERVVVTYNQNRNANQKNHEGNEVAMITARQVQERLSGLSREPDLALELQTAMQDMTLAAQMALVYLLLIVVECHSRSGGGQQQQLQLQLQDCSGRGRGRLERTQLLEWFGLCRAALKLGRVQRFLAGGSGGTSGSSLFDRDDPQVLQLMQSMMSSSGVATAIPTTTTGTDMVLDDPHLFQQVTMQHPHTRLEYTQRLLAQAVGWDPDSLTAKLRRLFVPQEERATTATRRTSTIDDDDDDNAAAAALLAADVQVQQLYRQTVTEMQQAAQRAASASAASGVAMGASGVSVVAGPVRHSHLNDMDDGGVTRVVNVQFSEMEITPDGRCIKVLNGAPSQQQLPTLAAARGGTGGGNDAADDGDDDRKPSAEEQKRQIRMASDATALQQEILGRLFAMPEHERRNFLVEAAEVSQQFQDRLMALSPGPQRIALLQSIDLATSQQLAAHKLWTNMLQANGGRPPKMAPK